MQSRESIELFFRCPRCHLPHSAGTTRCPITGESVGAIPAVPPSAAVTVKKSRPSGMEPVESIEPYEPPSPLKPGELLDRKYVVGAPLGSGGMGTVYDGHHVLLGRAVAIKAIHQDHEHNLAAQQRFLEEGRALAALAHPHVVQIYDLGLHRGVPYLVMERLQGRTLADRVAAEGPLPLADVLAIARQMLVGLGAVHARGLVHRDLKPANVFLAARPDGVPHVRLLDFGLSTAIESASTGRIEGTPAYLSPEQARGEASDGRADLWAVGVTLYEALTGKLPFQAVTFNGLMAAILRDEPAPLRSLRPDAPPELELVVARALRKRRDDRFASAEAMLAALGGEVHVEKDGDLALIAEPDPSRAEEQSRLATSMGLVSVVAGDGAEARELLSSIGIPRLLVTDLALAREDGFALLRHMRANAGAGETTAVVALSPVSALRAAARERKGELGIAAVLDARVPLGAMRRAFERALSGEGDAPAAAEAPRLTDEAERARLDRIAAMELVDGAPPDSALQGLVAETSRAFDMPVALVSLVLEDRQWFKAHVGLSGHLLENRGSPRSWAFCRHVVESGTPLVVPDARAHPYFADNPLVIEGAVGAYAGAPLVTPQGDVLGTLCIIDPDPRPISQDTVSDLVLLARRVAGELELGAERRARAANQGRTDAEAKARMVALLANLDMAVVLLGPRREIVFVNAAMAKLAGLPEAHLLGMSRDDFTRALAPIFKDPADYLRRVRVLPEGAFAAREDFVRALPSGGVLRWSAKPVELPEGIGQLETYSDLVG